MCKERDKPQKILPLSELMILRYLTAKVVDAINDNKFL